MALSSGDEQDLLTALHADEGGPPLSRFLDRLRRRTGALTAMLLERTARGGWLPPRTSSGGQGTRPIDPVLLQALRVNRVYDLDEIVPDPEDQEGVYSGRILRMGYRGGNLWLCVFGHQGAFDAADGVLLSNLAPHVAIACENRAREEDARTALAAAEAALARAGVGWALIDRDGEPISGHGASIPRKDRAALASLLDGGRPFALAGDTIATRSPAGEEAVLALYRTEAEPLDRAYAFAAHYGVRLSEARLAVALGEGASLSEAADQLGISEKTARHYSKQLYAATDTKGQADLVRLLWTGVTALA